MDLLRITDGKAYLFPGDKDEKLVSRVTTEDINRALGIMLEAGEVGLALGEDATAIANPAQKIVFEQLRSSFKEVLESKASIMEKVDKTFAAAEAKYLTGEGQDAAS